MLCFVLARFKSYKEKKDKTMFNYLILELYMAEIIGFQESQQE